MCDSTGTCCDPGHLDCAGFCFGDAELDCLGVCGGTAAEDAFGTCCLIEEQDCSSKCGGTAILDTCEVCRLPNDVYFDATCTGCDGIPVPPPGLPAEIDECGVCGGDGTSCLDCRFKLLEAQWLDKTTHDVVGSGLMVPVPLDTLSAAQWYDYDANNDRSFGSQLPNPTGNDAMSIVAVRDNTGGTFLAVTFDATSSSTAGSAWLQLGSTNAVGAGLVVKDDPDDTFIFDHVNVAGAFALQWGSYETDGFVIGPCNPQNGICFELKLKESNGVHKIKVLTWDSENNLLRDADPNHYHISAHNVIKVCSKCSEDLDCAGVGGGDHVVDACGVCYTPNDQLINTTCQDCNGVPNGPAVVDICGVCNGDGTSCLGCDGVPNSGAEVDACGVCGGDGSACEQCPAAGEVRHYSAKWLHVPSPFSVMFAPYQDVSASNWYGFNAGSFSSAQSRTRANRQHLSVVRDPSNRHYLTLINSRWSGAAGSGAGGDSGSMDLRFNFASDTSGAGTGFAVLDDPATSTDTYLFDGTQGSASWAWNADRTDGFALGPLPIDGCVTVRYDNTHNIGNIEIHTPEHLPIMDGDTPVHSDRVHPIPIYPSGGGNHGPELQICSWCVCPKFDGCGVCGGDNSTCAGCDGIPNSQSVLDECGVCGGDGSSCADCMGMPNGDYVQDACGVCRPPNDPNAGITCTDCAGIVLGSSSVDACGKCKAANDPTRDEGCDDCRGEPLGGWTYDQCGDCKNQTDSSRDQVCRDCTGAINGTAVIDDCGVCDGDNSTCVVCPNAPLERVVYHAEFLDCRDDDPNPAIVEAAHYDPGAIVPIPLADLPGSPANVDEFYAYIGDTGPGDLFSTNNVLDIELSNQGLIVFVEQPNGQVGLAVIYDRSHDGTGGMVSLEIDSLKVAGKGTQLTTMDDSTGADDSYIWNTVSGLGHMSSTWSPCCTDGFALSPVPFQGCFAFKFTKLLGLDGLKFVSYAHTADGNSTLRYLDIPMVTGRDLQMCSCCACAFVDECGVCEGDGSSCAGCDGVPNSGATVSLTRGVSEASGVSALIVERGVCFLYDLLTQTYSHFVRTG